MNKEDRRSRLRKVIEWCFGDITCLDDGKYSQRKTFLGRDNTTFDEMWITEEEKKKQGTFPVQFWTKMWFQKIVFLANVFCSVILAEWRVYYQYRDRYIITTLSRSISSSFITGMMIWLTRASLRLKLRLRWIMKRSNQPSYSSYVSFNTSIRWGKRNSNLLCHCFVFSGKIETTPRFWDLVVCDVD